MAESPKKPQKTNEEKALEERQRIALDKEIEEEEERLKAQSRGALGSKSLLAGIASTVVGRAGKAKPSVSSGGSMLSGRTQGGSSNSRNSLIR